MTIHQPRPWHPDGKHREWVISGDELTAFAVTLCLALANLTNELHTGSHCAKCRALATCPAATQAGYNSIEAASVAFSDEVPNEVLGFEIDNLRRASDAITLKLEAYEELAKHRVKSGQRIPIGNDTWSVERGQGNRTYVAGVTPEALAILTGKQINEITTRKLATPAALERLGVSTETLEAFTYRPPTAEKLVRFSASKAAKKLFS